MRLAVDRVEYLSGDRHLYGTVTGHRRADPRRRPAARHRRRSRSPPARSTSSRWTGTGCGTSTPTPAGARRRRGYDAGRHAGSGPRPPGRRPGPQAVRRPRRRPGLGVPHAQRRLHPGARGGAVRARRRVRPVRRHHRRPVASTWSGSATSRSSSTTRSSGARCGNTLHLHRRSRWCSSSCSARCWPTSSSPTSRASGSCGSWCCCRGPPRSRSSAIAWLWLLDSIYSPIDWVLRQLGLLGQPDAAARRRVQPVLAG